MMYDINLIEIKTLKSTNLDYQSDDAMDIDNPNFPNYLWFEEFLSDHLDEGALEEINEVFTITRKELINIINKVCNRTKSINKLLKSNEFNFDYNGFRIEIKKSEKRYNEWLENNK